MLMKTSKQTLIEYDPDFKSVGAGAGTWLSPSSATGEDVGLLNFGSDEIGDLGDLIGALGAVGVGAGVIFVRGEGAGLFDDGMGAVFGGGSGDFGDDFGGLTAYKVCVHNIIFLNKNNSQKIDSYNLPGGAPGDSETAWKIA